MGSRPLTTRQKHWLDHLTAAADSKGTLVDYARLHQLKPKHLYQWKKRLIALGYLDREGAVKQTAFVRVAPTPSRSQAVPVRLLDGFEGYLKTDGYEGYGKVCASPTVRRLGCMAHARRKFDEALKSQLKW